MRYPTRRALLRSAGAGGLASLAGCQEALIGGPDEPDPDDDAESNGDEPSDDDGGPSDDDDISLGGHWLTSSGGKWELEHEGSSVTGYTTGEAECDGDEGWVPTGDADARDVVMEGTFEDNTFSGTEQICYISSDEESPCYGQVRWENLELELSEDGNELNGHWHDTCNDQSVHTSLTRCEGLSLVDPLDDMSTFQSPGASGWRGAMYGCYRNNCQRPHRGWDLHASVGTPVVAAVSGEVTHHQGTHFGDFLVLTESGGDRSFTYAHLSAREPEGYYCAWEEIGEVGASGNASSDRPHLHIEVRDNNTRVDPAGVFTRPTHVVEEAGSQRERIDFSEPAPCDPCDM